MKALSLFIGIVVKSTLILSVATLASIALHRASASLGHAVLTLALLETLALPAITLITPAVKIPILTERTSMAALTTPGRDTGEWNTVSPTFGPTYSAPPASRPAIPIEPLVRPASIQWTGISSGQWLILA